MSHLDPGLLHELLDGEIPSTDLAPIQAHLASCEECRARLEYERQLQSDADGLVAAIELPQAAPPQASRAFRQPSSSRWRPGLAWAATLVLAAGLGYLSRGAGSPPVAHQESVAVPGSSGAQAIPATPPRSDSAITAPTRQAPPAERETRSVLRETLALPQQKTDSGIPGSAAGGSRGELRDQAAAKSLAGAPASGEAVAAAAPTTTKPVADRIDSVGKSGGGRGAAPARFAAGNALARTVDESRRAESPAANGQMARQRLDSAGVAGVPITLSEAVGRLGGTLRLIDGLVPLRLELREPYVRVVYPAAQGELVLQQQLIDGRVVFQIIPPRGFPADSLTRLRARVKE
jgi:anti-sigma factor RsiW